MYVIIRKEIKKIFLMKNSLYFRYLYYSDNNNMRMLVRGKIGAARSADLLFPFLGKPKDQLSSLKSLTKLEVMQSFCTILNAILSFVVVEQEKIR